MALLLRESDPRCNRRSLWHYGARRCDEQRCGLRDKQPGRGNYHSFLWGPPGRGRALRRVVARQDGSLYGTTSYGGIHNLGTVFKITASGEDVLYSFKGSDGANPYGGLILDSDGHLFGTTLYGGSGSCPSVGKNGCGTCLYRARAVPSTCSTVSRAGRTGRFLLQL